MDSWTDYPKIGGYRIVTEDYTVIKLDVEEEQVERNKELNG